jgi:hypothetical protein
MSERQMQNPRLANATATVAKLASLEMTIKIERAMVG